MSHDRSCVPRPRGRVGRSLAGARLAGRTATRIVIASGAPVSRPRHAFGNQPGRLPATLLRALCAELSDPGRYRRAKDYARDGAVIDIDVRPGVVVGAGARESALAVRVTIVRRSRSTTPATSGDGSPVMLIPERTELAVSCTCPDADSGAMCKHALALLLVLADEVSIEPELLARWRAAGGAAPAGTVRLRGRAARSPTHAEPDRAGTVAAAAPRAGARRRARTTARLADADRRAGTDGPVGAGGAAHAAGTRRRDVGRARPGPRRRHRNGPPHAAAGDHLLSTSVERSECSAPRPMRTAAPPGPTAMATPARGGFSRRVVTIAPGDRRPYVDGDWRDALVVIVRGAVELECTAAAAGGSTPGR